MKKQLLVFGISVLISAQALAYSPEGTTVTGTTSTATGNDTAGDDDSNSADYCYPYCNPDYSANEGGAGTQEGGAGGGTSGGTGEGGAGATPNTGSDGGYCAGDPMGSFESLLNGGASEKEIDAYTRAAIKAGGDGFLAMMTANGQTEENFDLTKALKARELDIADANSKPDDVKVYSGELPEGVDWSELSDVQKMGVANSTTVVASSQILTDFESGAESDLEGKSYAGLTIPNEYGAPGTSLVLIASDVTGDQYLQDTAMHEMFHAGCNALWQELYEEKKAGTLSGDSGDVKAQALAILVSTSPSNDSTTSDQFKDSFPVALGDSYYDEPVEFLAACSEGGDYCSTYKKYYAAKLVENGVSTDAAAKIISDMESDPTMKEIMKTLNQAVGYYINK